MFILFYFFFSHSFNFLFLQFFFFFCKKVEILGIDIDEHYILKASEKLSNHKNVTVKYMNFYEMKTDKKFDVILFSFSFMLMPDQVFYSYFLIY